MKTYISTLIFASLILVLNSCKSSQLPEVETVEQISTNLNGSGQQLTIEFRKGEKHNHPLMAIWVETEKGEYVQTLYVAESIGKGIFQHGDATSGKWLPGEIKRPAALPVWSHSRGVAEEDGLFVPTPEHAVPDAYTGATPAASFALDTKLDEETFNETKLDRFVIYFEINQTWDWNEYWTNNKYPDDDVYKTSCQPSLIYSVAIDLNDDVELSTMKLIGRGHHSGKNGEIFTDLETMTTALDITREITVLENNAQK